MAALLRKTTDPATNQTLIQPGSGGGLQFYIDGASKPTLWTGAASASSTFTVLVSEGWVLVGVTKATGTVVPRFHKYVFSTDTWTHTDSATSIANAAVPGGGCKLGAKAGPGDFFDGDLAGAAVWDIVLADTQVEALPFGLLPWFAPATPKALWLLDQSAVGQKVLDLTGNGSDETAITGTAVSTGSVPVFNIGVGPSSRRLASLPGAALFPGMITAGGGGIFP